ncbi:MAG: hypothetical protein LBC52_05520 [Treponema sp.]|jgi:hypothetical protein|nr:hypothetical protein [Treponema sp.]
MKQNILTSFLTTLFFLILFAACTGQQKKVIFRPDAANNNQEQARLFDSWEIINSQNGQGSAGIPEWVRWYIDNEIKEIEALDRFSGKYIFVGDNGGGNFSALQQWANGYTVEQDLPRLITRRAERRLVSSASLYPDDEYGEYYEFLIRDISNGEYSSAVKEQTFWLKRRIVNSAETDDVINPQSKPDTAQERYEFLVLISVDKETLQKQIQGIMARIKTKIIPTKEQAAAIAKIKNTFFEGF